MKLLFLILFSAVTVLYCSCSQPSNPKRENQVNLEPMVLSHADSLRFSSGIRAIFQDSKGNYWIGSHAEGVCKYNGKTFEYFNTQNGLSDNQIRTIQEDSIGNIWLGTANGINKFDGQKITNIVPNALNKMSGVWVHPKNTLWFSAGIKQGFYAYNETLNYIDFPRNNASNSGSVYSVTSIAPASDGAVWLATYPAVFKFNGKAFTAEINNASMGYNPEFGLHVRSVFEDSKGRLWMGNNGIGVLLKEGEELINFSEKHHLTDTTKQKMGSISPPGTLEHVFAIAEDKVGNIWFGDRDTGVWKFNGLTIVNISIDPKLESQFVWQIYKNPAGNLLFALAKGGVYEFNGASFIKLF